MRSMNMGGAVISKNIMKAESCIKRFVESCFLKGNAILEGDYKTHNREMNKIIRVFKRFEKDKELAEVCLKTLLEYGHPFVQISAAAQCLALGMFIKEAEAALDKIGKEENNIIGFNAEMTLQVWKEKGKLELY